MELSEQKCEACSDGGQAMSAGDANEMLRQVPAWEIKNGAIERTFKFGNFMEALNFANKIAEIAERENHHPDLHISWGKVRVELSTHKVNGLTNNDFIMAAKINGIVEGS